MKHSIYLLFIYLFVCMFLFILYANRPGHDPGQTRLYTGKSSFLGYWGFIISFFYNILWYSTWRFIMHIFEIV